MLVARMSVLFCWRRSRCSLPFLGLQYRRRVPSLVFAWVSCFCFIATWEGTKDGEQTNRQTLVRSLIILCEAILWTRFCGARLLGAPSRMIYSVRSRRRRVGIAQTLPLWSSVASGMHSVVHNAALRTSCVPNVHSIYQWLGHGSYCSYSICSTRPPNGKRNNFLHWNHVPGGLCWLIFKFWWNAFGWEEWNAWHTISGHHSSIAVHSRWWIDEWSIYSYMLLGPTLHCLASWLQARHCIDPIGRHCQDAHTRETLFWIMRGKILFSNSDSPEMSRSNTKTMFPYCCCSVHSRTSHALLRYARPVCECSGTCWLCTGRYDWWLIELHWLVCSEANGVPMLHTGPALAIIGEPRSAIVITIYAH